MAKVICTLKYKRSKLTKTYQVTFDQNDSIEVVTETKGLVIKASNARAKALLPALKNGNTVQGRPGEFDLAPAQAAVRPASAQFRFSADQAKVAKFECGFR